MFTEPQNHLKTGGLTTLLDRTSLAHANFGVWISRPRHVSSPISLTTLALLELILPLCWGHREECSSAVLLVGPNWRVDMLCHVDDDDKLAGFRTRDFLLEPDSRLLIITYGQYVLYRSKFL